MKRRALFWLSLALLVVAAPRMSSAASPSPVDSMLAALKAAPNEAVAAALEMQIHDYWAHQATPAVRLLLSRGARELSENAPDEALDSFDAALDLAPDLLEAWRGRAEARRALGDYVGAVHDLEQSLRLEPRDFLALQELSRIAEARGDWRSALAAWTKVLELSPHTPQGEDRLKDLRRRALGEEL